ncbi:PREDICTED: BTB/POZ domain-containing protein kctd15-like isoform X1 [Acropora digitifera]|nr:PREDICTED: BTB/POZ domain-containing protein kctd15-like isoform X1 [Acropora digitifera]
MASERRFPHIMNLNVGGFVYTTTLNTITRDPNSMLGRMFSGRQEIAKDSKGNYFIDRDGSLFRHVLNFLRTWELCLPQPFDEFEQLRAEADFYQVGDLIKALQIPGEGRRKNPPSSDGLGVIIIFAKSDNGITRLYLKGREELIKEVFEEYTYQFCKRNGQYIEGEFTVPPWTAKARVFEHLCRHGFQLEGCNGGINEVAYPQFGDYKATEFQEYTFVRKNKLSL